MTAMEPAAEALADTLTEESLLCADLLALTQREEAAIIASDLPTLTSLVDEKEQVLELLATLETERMTALTAIAAATGQAASTLTLSLVTELVPPGARTRLVTTSERMRSTGLALEQANERNARLLRMSSDLVERWVQYLKAIISSSLTYSPDGTPQGATSNRVLDRSA